MGSILVQRALGGGGGGGRVGREGDGESEMLMMMIRERERSREREMMMIMMMRERKERERDDDDEMRVFLAAVNLHSGHGYKEQGGCYLCIFITLGRIYITKRNIHDTSLFTSLYKM